MSSSPIPEAREVKPAEEGMEALRMDEEGVRRS